jgi:hypothetical protein
VPLLALLLVALAAAALRAVPRGASPLAGQIDFVAFECAAKVEAAGADPYLAEPLRSCERAAVASSGREAVPNLVVPAPLPPYALEAFGLFAPLGFRDAGALWPALALVAVGATVVLVRSLTGLPVILVAAAFLSADAVASLPIGQLVPLVLCALCGAALALQRGRPQLAALLTAPLLFEPHVGLPAMLALFVWEPRARPMLLAVTGAAGLLSLAAGFERNAEYVRVVLPAQALAEGLDFSGQYGLSALLAALGVAPAAALAWGTASYAAMAGASIALAGRVARKLDEPAGLLLLPPACVIFGGTYVHVHQIAFALPFLCLLLARRPGTRALTLAALVLLAVPWQTVAEIPRAGHARSGAGLGRVQAELRRVASGSLPAESAWGVWVRSDVRDSRTTWERFECKVPTWLGLAFLVAAASLVARERHGFTRDAKIAPDAAGAA